MSYESEQEAEADRKYYGGTPIHCWACGSQQFNEIRCQREHRWWVFYWGKATLRATCGRCYAVTGFRPGTIRPSRASHYTWVRNDARVITD